MGLRDAIAKHRAKQAEFARQQTEPANSPPQGKPPPGLPKPAPKPPGKPKMEVERVEQLAHACGHPGPLEVLKGHDPAHAKIRREKHTAKLCKACNEVEQARIQAEAAERRNKPPRQRKPRVCSICQEKAAKRRLPHGSLFQANYDATKEVWRGSLIVDGQEFHAESEGVMRLMADLDKQYAATFDKEDRTGKI